jgi:excisionase family DNA binding protein
MMTVKTKAKANMQSARGGNGLYYPDDLVSGARMMEHETEWITTHEAAELMQVELSTVSKLCRKGDLTCRQHGTGRRSVWEVSKQSALAYQKVIGRPRKRKSNL